MVLGCNYIALSKMSLRYEIHFTNFNKVPVTSVACPCLARMWTLLPYLFNGFHALASQRALQTRSTSVYQVHQVYQYFSASVRVSCFSPKTLNFRERWVYVSVFQDYFQRPQMNEIFARKTDELRRQSVPEAMESVNNEHLGL